LLQGGIVRILLFELRQQHLYVLQLATLFPIIDEQYPRFAIGRMALDDF